MPSGHRRNKPKADVVPLNRILQGRIIYVVAMDAVDGKLYSIGIRHIKYTNGATDLMQQLQKQRMQPSKDSFIYSLLCPSVGQTGSCPFGDACAMLHVDEEGYRLRRPWIGHQRAIPLFSTIELVDSATDRRQLPYLPENTDTGVPLACSSCDQGFTTGLSYHAYCTIPMSKEQRAKGHVAHNPYLPMVEAAGDTFSFF